MFGSIKTLISNLVENAKPSNSANGYDNWLATAALLTRVATVHNEMSEDRRKKLYTVLRSTFRLDDPTTAQLIEESTAVDREAIDLYHYTRQLNEEFDDEDRRHTVRMMWEVVYADGNANEFEANIIWRAATCWGCLRDKVSSFAGKWRLTMPLKVGSPPADRNHPRWR